MRILWFTNTPSLASDTINKSKNVGGWISSLEKQLLKGKNIELAVAFPNGFKDSQVFSVGNTIYYTFPFLGDKGIVKGLIGRWLHRIEPDSEIENYLKIIEQFKPDIIHIFGSERSFGLLCKRTNIPIVLQIQGNLTVCLTKWFSGITFMNILLNGNKKNLILGYGIFHEYFLIRKRAKRERLILSNCRNIIGRTDWDKRISRIFSPDSTYFHCDEVLRDIFYTREWSYKIRGNVVIFSTISATTYKGLETILQASNLLKSIGRFEFEWHVAGIKGIEEIVDIIEKELNMKFINNNVLFINSLGPDELVSCLLESSCYVHPSHLENSPNSVCEAMILGVPVIATSVGGTSSMLINGVEGILVQDGDPYVLAGAIIELLESAKKIKLFSENARKKALARHNPTVILNTVIDIYNRLIIDRV